jgi:zinc transport system permease protein
MFTLLGLWISYRYDLSSGASIILVAGLAFFLNLLIVRMIPARRISAMPAVREATVEMPRS